VLWNPLSFLEDEGFDTQENFTQFQVDSGYTSLRDFMDNAQYSVTDGADQACGWSDPDGIPQQIPEDGTMRTSGYTHDGPCEIYMGDTLALSYLNCHESITDMTFSLDYSGCGSSCVLYWYWLGVRYLDSKYSWQVYKECIPLYSGSSTATTTTTAPTTASSSTGSAAAPEADTQGSQTSGSSSTTETQAPSTPTTTEKCNAARRRVRV
jgi:hypothetical protein